MKPQQWARYRSMRVIVLAMGIVVAAAAGARAAPYAAMVMDARTGEVLHSRNADARLHPASTTKMMTLYIAFEAVKNGEITLDTPVTVSRNAANEVPSKLGLRAGQKIRLRYLIRAAAVRSANDAATAIGEAISGSESAFARRMTLTARAIGMRNTTFVNAHGLTHPGHLSTARDMTILGRQLLYDYPQYYNLFSRRTADAQIARVRNTNRRFLDAYTGADGIKTGYTNAAGFNLVGSAKRNGVRIIATVFGGNSVTHRNARMAELLDMGFSRAPMRVAVREPKPPAYSNADTNGRAGRTIRLNTATATSLRPRPRPGSGQTEIPETVVADLRDDIGKVLAEVSRADTREPALADVEQPEPRPSDLVSEAATEVAEVEADQAAVTRSAGDVSADAGAPVEEEEAVIQLTTSAQPRSRPSDNEFAALAQSRSEGEDAAVVRQAESDGERDWGINIGRFGSRFAAERALLQTALAELTALEDATREVDRGAQGFDATFTGLTRAEADLACRRLQAREQTCFAVAP